MNEEINIDYLKELANSCKTRQEFRKKYKKEYQLIKNNRELKDKVFSNLRVNYIKKDRCIYVYEFPEYKVAYIGLTASIKNRSRSHKSNENDPIRKFCMEKDIIIPISPTKILEDFMPEEKSGEREDYWRRRYEDEGWTTLNTAPCGSLGGAVTSELSPLSKEDPKEYCREMASKYDNYEEFKTNEPLVYRFMAGRKGWLGELTFHMKKEKRSPKLYFSFEKCKEITDKYNVYKDFEREQKGLLNYISRKGWKTELTKHMKRGVGITRTKEDCIKIVSNYTDLKTFRKEQELVYNYIRKHNWNEILSNLTREKSIQKTFSYEECELIVNKYDNYDEFRLKEPEIHHYILYSKVFKKNGYREKLLSKFPKRLEQYTFEDCKSLVKTYTSWKEVEQKDPILYKKCKINYWIRELTEYFIRLDRNRELDSKCIEISKTITSDKIFKKKYPNEFKYAEESNLLPELRKYYLSGKKDTMTWEECISFASKVKNQAELKREYRNAFNFARTKNRLQELNPYYKKGGEQ